MLREQQRTLTLIFQHAIFKTKSA